MLNFRRLWPRGPPDIYIYIYIYIQYASRNPAALKVGSKPFSNKSHRVRIPSHFASLFHDFWGPRAPRGSIFLSFWHPNEVLKRLGDQKGPRTLPGQKQVNSRPPAAPEKPSSVSCFLDSAPKFSHFLGMCFPGVISLRFSFDSWTLGEAKTM